jgi:hypothetical protein
MSDFYGRKYQVLIGPRGEPGILVEGLRCTFAIEKTLTQEPNQTTIEIYNLSPKNRNLILDRETSVIVNAGYEGTMRTIFVGDVVKVTPRWQSTDIVLQIEAGDGQNAYNNARLDISLAPGTNFRRAFEVVVESLGLTRGEVKGVNDEQQFLNGLTLSGSSKEQMNMLMERQGLGWSIQDGQIQVLPRDDATSEEAILLTPETGLIGSPFQAKVIRQDTLARSSLGALEGAISVTSLLNPRIRPGRRIRVQSRFIDGTFIVEKVRHFGDTHGKPWYTEVEAR